MNNSYRLWSLWDMLQDYFPVYQVAQQLQAQKSQANLLRTSSMSTESEDFRLLIEMIRHVCLSHGLNHTMELAKKAMSKPPPKTYQEVFFVLDHLNDSLSHELEKEAIFRIPPERKNYYEQDDLFGPEVTAAFPSCTRDIKNAGSCYALAQADACVHHLMLVLERGLRALAAKVGVQFRPAGWQSIIDDVEKKLKSSTLPVADRIFYNEVNAQFGFLKVAYRNHSEHAHDDPYDIPKALSIFNHARSFMQELQKGGLSE